MAKDFLKIVTPSALYGLRRREVIASGSGYFNFGAGETLWETGDQAGKYPFNYKNYQGYASHLRAIGKEYSLLPEYRVSDNIKYFVDEKGGNFYAPSASLDWWLSLSGSEETNYDSSSYYVKYCDSNKMTYLHQIDTDHKNTHRKKGMTLNCGGIMKLLPYEGFYPVQRTLQIVSLFSQSYANISQGWKDGTFQGDSRTKHHGRPLWQPFFAPGLFYNTIKAGIAVDHPVFLRNDYTISGSSTNKHDGTGEYAQINSWSVACINQLYDTRLPFETLIEPETYVTNNSLYFYDGFPDLICSALTGSGHPVTVPFSCSLGKGGSPIYSMAMHNFLAETCDTFLANNNFTSIVSKPDTDPSFGIADKNKTYIMRVKLFGEYKSGSEGTTAIGGYYYPNKDYVMYSSGYAFGPPTLGVTANSYQYGSFTPPYFDSYLGDSITLSFKPYKTGSAGDSQKYTLNEIVSNLTATIDLTTVPLTSIKNFPARCPNTHRYNASSNSEITRDIFKQYREEFYNRVDNRGNIMRITASINYANVIKIGDVQYNAITGKAEKVNEQNPGYAWVIQPKFETPMFNFKNCNLTYPLYGSGSVNRGMWHQYRNVYDEKMSEGIMLQVDDAYFETQEQYSLTNIGSLADLVGFDKQPHKLGQVNDSKTMREAIVAIPFYYDGHGDKQYYRLRRDDINTALQISDKGTPGQSIIDMVEKMQRFVFPPNLDFITNKDAKPIAMYIFEFTQVWNKKDLADWWQNLPPDTGLNVDWQDLELKHDFAPHELIEDFKNNTQFTVFKVKQKGKWNYFEKTANPKDDDRFKFLFNPDKSNKVYKKPDYSYNWPYDYFSLVELGKLECEIEFEKEDG